MDAYIEEILKDTPDDKAPAALAGLVQNILDEDIPEDVKHKLLMPLIPAKARPQRKKREAPKEEPWREFDPLLQQKGPETLEIRKYYSLFVSGAHLRFPNGEATMLETSLPRPTTRFANWARLD